MYKTLHAYITFAHIGSSRSGKRKGTLNQVAVILKGLMLFSKDMSYISFSLVFSLSCLLNPENLAFDKFMVIVLSQMITMGKESKQDIVP